MRFHPSLLALCLVATLNNCSAGQDTYQEIQVQSDKPVKIATGVNVSEMSKSIWSVFQDKNNNHWFSSNGQGVYRYDGKTLTQFTTKHGLPDNRIRGIQQHKSGDILINTTKGISRYDGHTLTTINVAEKHPPGRGWTLQPDDLWFGGPQNSGAVYRYDGESLHQLAFPRTKRGDDHYARLPRDKFPNASYSRKLDMLQQNALFIFQKDWKQLDKIKLHLQGTEFQLKVSRVVVRPKRGTSGNANAAHHDSARKSARAFEVVHFRATLTGHPKARAIALKNGCHGVVAVALRINLPLRDTCL